MPNLRTNHEETRTIAAIFCRARELEPLYDGLDGMMDISAAHLNGCPLDLDQLLAADDPNFLLDVVGIQRNINRQTGELDNCFAPRFTRPVPEAA